MVAFGILAFIALQLLIGFIVRNKISSEDDYLVAGRSLGPFLSLFTVFATWFGAESCISAAGGSFRHGFTLSSPEPFGYGLALVVMGAVFAVTLWRKKLTTLSDLFRIRYNEQVEKLSVLLIAPTSLLWGAAQILAFSQILASIFGIDLTYALVASGGIVITYTAVGGMMADAWTDAVQGVTLIIGLVAILVVFTILHPVEYVDLNLKAMSQIFSQKSEYSLIENIEIWLIPICGSVVSQELIARVCVAKSPDVAKFAGIYGGFLYIVIGFIPLTLGIAGRSFFPNLEDSDKILPLIIQTHLPEVFGAVFLGSLISIILSSVDSALLAAGAVISHNIILPALPPALKNKSAVFISRATVVVLGIITCIIAAFGDNIYDLVEEASSFGSAGLFVVFVAAFSRIGDALAAAATLITGVVSWVLLAHVFEVAVPYIWSLVFCFVVYFGISLSKQVAKPFATVS